MHRQRRSRKKFTPKVKYVAHDHERRFKETLRRDDERDQFERDRSRVIYSAAFRRLQGKTQVFTVGEGDFFRSRLTHSIEVAQIGKGLALRMGADPTLVEAICLVHDIGHPPFGHAGETELKLLMKEYGGFEANAQNIRLLTLLEQKSTKYTGLNLTRATLDGQLKYKQKFTPKIDRKKFYYAEDEEFVEWASETAFPDSESQSFECQIMDWADEVAYAVHDLEDGIHAGLISGRTFYDSTLRDKMIDVTAGKLNADTPNTISIRALGDLWSYLHKAIFEQMPAMQPMSLTAPKSLQTLKIQRKQLTSWLIGRYIRNTERRERTGDAVSGRYKYSLYIPIELQAELKLLNQLVWNSVIESSQVVTLEQKGRYIVRRLFERMFEDKHFDRLLPEDWRELIDVPCTDPEKARTISDYISGMTDLHAQRIFSRLFLPNHGTIYDLL